MTLAEHLEQTGIRLGQKVGFIVESYDETGKWRAVYARIGRVVTSVPDGTRDQEEVQDFDPEYDLLLLWEKGTEMQLCILRMVDGATLYHVDPGGLIIEASGNRICIGQSDSFMNSVCEIWCALGE